MASNNFSVVFDANVLYPQSLRDFLMRLATSTSLFRAKWSDDIHDEWIRSVLRDKPAYSKERLQRTRDLMNKAVPDSLIERDRYDAIVASLTLPDSDDRHVLASAIVSQSELIVTFNIKHFPKKYLRRYQIEAVHPDEFVRDLIQLDKEAVFWALENQQRSLRRPPLTIPQLLDILSKRGLVVSSGILQSHYLERLRRISD